MPAEIAPADPGTTETAVPPVYQIPLPFTDVHVGFAVLLIVAAAILAAVALTSKKK